MAQPYADAAEAGSVERTADLEKNPAGVVRRWLVELELADKAEASWRKDARRVLELYRRQRKSEGTPRARFNILFANQQTLAPTLLAKMPTPDVRRRYADADPLGRKVADVIERSLAFSLDDYDCDAVLKRVVQLDYILTGRGVARLCYEPQLDDAGNVAYQRVYWKDIAWDDFRVSPAASWANKRWVAFRDRWTRDELVKRFPKMGKDVPLDWSPADIGNQRGNKAKIEIADAMKRAEVWEIWDGERRQQLFIAPGYRKGPLATTDDPYELRDFYPLPRPLYSIPSNDSLVPYPEYLTYESQAKELNTVTARIDTIVNALRARGIYDATIPEFEEVFRSDDTALVPAKKVAAMYERGGLEKAVWMLPLDKLIQTLGELYKARQEIKQTIYEIIGLADIMRGSTIASETATAQQIKSRWGSLRMQDRQTEVQRFIRDMMRLHAELVAEHFEPATLSLITGIDVTPEMLTVLRDDALRRYRVDIETDSTIQPDADTDQKNIVALLQAVVEFITGIGPAVQSGQMPLEAAKSMLLAGVRRFRLGREVEDAINMIGQKQAAPEGMAGAAPGAPGAQPGAPMQPGAAMPGMQSGAQPGAPGMPAVPPPPTPEEIAAQQQQMQADAEAKAMNDRKLGIDEHRAQTERMKHEATVTAADNAHGLAHRELRLKERAAGVPVVPTPAEAQAMQGYGNTLMAGAKPLFDALGGALATLNQRTAAVQAGEAQILQALSALTALTAAPRMLIKDARGKAVGVRIVMPPEAQGASAQPQQRLQ